jgi:hypothetical protein
MYSSSCEEEISESEDEDTTEEESDYSEDYEPVTIFVEVMVFAFIYNDYSINVLLIL